MIRICYDQVRQNMLDRRDPRFTMTRTRFWTASDKKVDGCGRDSGAAQNTVVVESHRLLWLVPINSGACQAKKVLIFNWLARNLSIEIRTSRKAFSKNRLPPDNVSLMDMLTT